MRTRKLVLAAGTAAALLVVAPGTASANVVWCLSDPPQQLVTPAGNYIVVNTTLYASPSVRHQLSAVTETTESVSDGAGGTLVTVHVFVPQTVGSLTVVATVQRYQLSTTRTGGAGSEITLQLDVPSA